MAELSALNVRITGDASGLEAAVAGATRDLRGLATTAQTASSGTTRLSGTVAALGGAFTRNRFAIQNASFQIQDIAVQMAMGTSASRALGQQLPQLLGGFGAIGAVLGTVVGIGLPLFVSLLGQSATSADTATDAIDRMRDAMKQADDASEILELSQAELVERFGASAQAAREAAQAIQAMSLAQIRVDLRAVASEVGEVSAAYTEAAIVADEFGTNIDISENLRAIRRDLGLNTEQATAFRNALIELDQATGAEERAQALSAIREILEQSAGAMERIPQALRDAITAAGEFTVVMAEASAIAANMTFGTPLQNVTLPGDGPSGRPTRGGGGGGGGRARVNPLVAQIEALRESLATELELEMQNHAARQEMLQAALAQRLITQQEHNELMKAEALRHAEELAQIDVWRYGSGLDRASMFFGQMAQAFASGNEEMLRISRVFGAAQALISAWQGAAEALKLPFPANLAAFAQVLATGLGAVNAIRSVGKGGGGGGGGSASVSGGGNIPVQRLIVETQGNGSISQSTLSDIIDRINDAGRRGYRIDARYIQG